LDEILGPRASSPAGDAKVNLLPGGRRGRLRSKFFLALAFCFLAADSLAAQQLKVSTIAGNGTPGFSDQQVNNPYGLVIGPDGGLYFCDLDNQRIRRLDLKSKTITTIVGNGQRGFSGDGGQATNASLNMPHELRFDKRGDLYIVERDNHVVRKVDMRTKVITTFAGTGVAGFSGDGGPAVKAQLRSPHSIAFDRNGNLLICDVGNHRIRRVDSKGVITTYAGTGERKPTPDGAPLAGTPLNGPRTIDVASNGNLYLALREGNAIYRIDPKLEKIFLVAGTGEQGYAGDGGPAVKARFAGPKGLAYSKDHNLYVVDTENHVIRRVDLKSGVVTTVLGTGEKGDGPESDPLRCKLNRPHGVFVSKDGSIYIGDSEAHRIRLLKTPY
jgi:DNA-binding beta-propeller fold protein YncE